MKISVAVALLIVLFTAMSGASGARPSHQQIISDYDYDDVRISPTGKYLAVTRVADGEGRFQIFKMPERKATFSSNLGEKTEVDQMLWVSDDHLLIAPARRVFGDVKFPTGELMAVDAKRNKIRRLAAKDCPYCGGRLVHTLPDDPRHIIVSGSRDQYNEAHLVDIVNGNYRRITRSPIPRGFFVASADGDIVFSVGTNAENHTVVERKTGQKWEPVTSFRQDEQGWQPFSDGPAPGTFLTWDTRGATGTRGLGLYDINSGEHKMLIRFAEVDVSSIFRDHDYRVYGVRTDPHFPAIYDLDPDHPLARIRRNLKNSFPNDTVTFTSSTRDNLQVVALVSGDRNPGRFVLVDLKAKSAEVLFSRKAQLTPDMLAPMNPFRLQARDGTTINGYVTSPDGMPTPGPMIVVVHGGPFGIRDTWGYNPEAQLLASRGAHVLSVNFRGSGGYGLDFRVAGYRQWGAAMQDDVTDATLWAIQNKIADPDRICIYGGSYGAYAAMMGAAREPDLYRCAIGVAGVYDLTIMDSKGDVRSNEAGESFIRRTIGDDDEALAASSPVNLAGRIKADVLLIHGGQDRRAPIAHANRMRAALEAAGKEVGWHTDTLQSHGFAGQEGRTELYRLVDEFLAPHMGWASNDQ